MKFSMAVMRPVTEVKVPRQMAWRVMIEKKTMVSHAAQARAGRGLPQGRRKCRLDLTNGSIRQQDVVGVASAWRVDQHSIGRYPTLAAGPAWPSWTRC